jgi:hypothetical protein
MTSEHAEPAAYLIRRALLDRNVRAHRRGRVDRAARCDHDEGYPRLLRVHGERIRAHLVRRVTIRCDTVRTDQHDVDHAIAQQQWRCVVDCERARYPRTLQLPGCDAAALQQRTRLARIHVQIALSLVRVVQRCERGAHPGGGEGARVADSKGANRSARRQQRVAVLGEPLRHRLVFLQNRIRLAIQLAGDDTRVFGAERIQLAAQAVDGPGEVCRGRPRSAQLLIRGSERAHEFCPRHLRVRGHFQREPERGGNTDRRRTTDFQPADRIGNRAGIAQIHIGLGLWKRGLVEDLDAARVGSPAHCYGQRHACRPRKS